MQKTKINHRKVLFTSLIIIFLLVAGGVYFVASRNNKQVATPEGFIDYGPPTEEDKEHAERNKERIIKEQEQSADTEPQGQEKYKVVPVVGFLRQADSRNVEANGYISETIESDGICTLTLEKDGQKVSAAKQARPDAQSTICGLITIERNKLAAGEWKATISYSSAKYQGTSAEKTIMVN